MKIILCVLIVWYFHSNHALDAKGDLLQNVWTKAFVLIIPTVNSFHLHLKGDPEAPFFAGRGRRGGELNSFEGQFGENKDGAPSASDARRYFDPDLLESRMRLRMSNRRLIFTLLRTLIFCVMNCSLAITAADGSKYVSCKNAENASSPGRPHRLLHLVQHPQKAGKVRPRLRTLHGSPGIREHLNFRY